MIEDVYEKIDAELLGFVEDVLLNRRSDSTERLMDFAATIDKKSEPCHVRRLAAVAEPVVAPPAAPAVVIDPKVSNTSVLLRH